MHKPVVVAEHTRQFNHKPNNRTAQYQYGNDYFLCCG
jgi:hypothetical protein